MIPISLAFGASFFLFGTLNNVLYVVSPSRFERLHLREKLTRFIT
jgi:hypothetical protein